MDKTDKSLETTWQAHKINWKDHVSNEQQQEGPIRN